MAEDPKLSAERREKLGSAECRRIRASQRVPGNVYGHGEEPAAIAVAEDVLTPIVVSGHKVVDLELGGGTEKAILREVQWDTFGSRLVHFDLQRVSADERVTTEVAIETHGTSPGVVGGGMLELPLHTLRIQCPAIQIPDRIAVNINGVELGQSIHVRDIKVPDGIKILNDPDEVVLHVVRPSAGSDEEGGMGGPAEPEVIKKPTEGAANE